MPNDSVMFSIDSNIVSVIFLYEDSLKSIQITTGIANLVYLNIMYEKNLAAVFGEDGKIEFYDLENQKPAKEINAPQNISGIKNDGNNSSSTFGRPRGISFVSPDEKYILNQVPNSGTIELAELNKNTDPGIYIFKNYRDPLKYCFFDDIRGIITLINSKGVIVNWHYNMVTPEENDDANDNTNGDKDNNDKSQFVVLQKYYNNLDSLYYPGK